MNEFPFKNLLFGLAGAIVGGGAGIFIFCWMASQNYYAAVIPGALVGLGFGLAARKRHVAFGVISALNAIAVTGLAEWRAFVPSRSFSDFLDWYFQEGPITWIMLAIGVAMAFSFGMGRDPYRSPAAKSDS